MNRKNYEYLKIALLLLVFIGGIAAAYSILKPKRRLPVYNPSDLDPRLVAENLQGQGRLHRVKAFRLINQYGDTISESDLEGKIYVADFFFTVCPDICKDMAREKRRLQARLQAEPDFVILSHSVTPQADSVPVLRAYAEKQGAIKGKWHLLTGPKPHIYALARESYFAVLDQGGKGDESDFIHTENFVLVDKEKRIRGFYDGTSREDVDRLIDDYYLLAETYAEAE